MPNQIVRRSNFTVDALSVRKAQEVMIFAEDAAEMTEITNAAGYEMAQIAIYAANAMSDTLIGIEGIHQRLVRNGYDNPIFEDMQAKVQMVTGSNLITMANVAQKEILQAAIAAMR